MLLSTPKTDITYSYRSKYSIKFPYQLVMLVTEISLSSPCSLTSLRLGARSMQYAITSMYVFRHCSACIHIPLHSYPSISSVQRPICVPNSFSGLFSTDSPLSGCTNPASGNVRSVCVCTQFLVVFFLCLI